MNFANVSVADLDSASTSAMNGAAFGIVKMSHDGKVTDYNDWQSKFTGMSKSAVIGKHFFSQVAPCTNNFMVSQKYDAGATLDESLDYTFTLKMAPTPVKLRLLKGANSQYLLCNK
ncbi:photoactive yellow protein [Salinibius halmophilus]|uniref:photoactive yellow protein n=1 Tax=Salinibius halmophilus TaxID=1853216 RepID=UPI000E6705B8|nr:photoactive yellow protein [Salinibius halmophilus]